MEFNNILFQPPVRGRQPFLDHLIKINNVPVLVTKSEQNSTSSNGTVLYFHGNATDAPGCIEECQFLANKLGATVMAVEYPGYWVYNRHRPDASQIKRDAIAVLSELNKTIPFSKIIVIGVSIGTGPAAILAKYPLRGLLLITPFTSIRDLAYSYVGHFSFLLSDSFNNLDSLSKPQCPILVAHGTSDTIIPHEHALTIAKKTGCKLLTIKGASHNGIGYYWPTILDRMMKYFPSS
jgi:pimeloyl-ACP methyl ester carboxylesterase